MTNTVIDDFSNPERQETDTWVAIYGKNNRFDHNSLLNKGNRGVTLAVKMNTEDSRENDHVIEYNYFGPRQPLGSNGGETLRVGTSHYSREYSNTVVQYNYFDDTSGELEIISSKSCGNAFRGNVFYESQGTLTMRHGHFTLVENNYFLGNRKPNTGGIRIINENQTVRNNYLYGLTGHRFRGALVIMNGVPNSPLNRYDPVVDSLMNNNIVVDSDHIQLCAGSDEERSAVPTGSSMHNNLIMGKTNLNPFTVYDDVSGISFEGNVVNEEAGVPIDRGFSKAPYSVAVNENGLRVPAQSLIDGIGFGEVRLPVTKEETGAAFYPKKDRMVAHQSGDVIPVQPGEDTIVAALAESQAGDTLLLESSGEYLLTRNAAIRHPITIKTEGDEKAVIRSEKASFFVIENGGGLELDNLWLDGAESPDQPGNNVISTSRYSMNRNYSLGVRNSRVTNLDVNHSFDFLKVYMNTFADSIEIVDTEMTNITGSILSLDKETDDLGVYNVENLTITGSSFTDIQGSVANVYRGGTDESTFGPIIVVDDNEFSNVGLGGRNKTKASLRFSWRAKAAGLELRMDRQRADRSFPHQWRTDHDDPGRRDEKDRSDSRESRRVSGEEHHVRLEPAVNQNLRVLICGTGYAGQGHAAAFKAASAEVVGIVGRTEKVAREVAVNISVPFAGTDWSQALRDCQPDIVSIGTPGGAHVEPIRAALERGCHVFCDKPLTESGDSAKTLYELALAKGVKTAFAASYRYMPEILHAKRLVASGAIGEPLEAECVSHFNLERYIPFGWSHRSEAGGGRLNNNFTHLLSIVTSVIGDKVLAVSGEVRNDMGKAPIVEGVHNFKTRRDFIPEDINDPNLEWGETDVEWSYTVLAQLESRYSAKNPVSVMFRHGGLHPRFNDDHIVFYGSEGAIYIKGHYGSGPLFLCENGNEWGEVALPADIAASMPDIDDDTQRNWTYLAREFVKDIQGFPVEPYPTFREGSHYQQIIDLLRKNDRWVDVSHLS